MTEKFRLWFDEPLPHTQPTGPPTLAQRFAVPHDFPPDLTLLEALVRVAGALARILLGSALFAFWGLFAARVWNSITSLFWHAVVLLPLLALFAVPFAGLMIGVASLVRKLSPQRH
ncbi:MAG TPA: hypothetical protein VKT81_08685 [Bryobacteraceae bacterium]|nr:hypothetical protein [Bryobacteraceae bacterium]